MLTREEISRVHEKKIPCTRGGSEEILQMGPIFNNFIVAMDSQSAMPTDQELAILASYQEFVVKKWYFDPDPERILAAPFPAIEGYNTVIFLKGNEHRPNGPEGWCFRRMTWVTGPTFAPTFATSLPQPAPWTLVQVIDCVEYLGKKYWEEWKKEHPDIFA
ncbi:MAG: hypothetical protein CO002_01040 [Candidatus Portnoybacteria bacterium CG_4_8_14_3_um_filter_44_10]|uniref:Uncharacterized protein n=4 Tax=Candidatus Portnoyibacteriota TaxID=1817913 RepID=A0A2H0KTP6_9BACT|nr:MAG: hypothetical protein COV85_00830 [Candidatus Portnoybacteria bacterium CG11_big_fil_rev_8_21_14_0_20_44_10]PIS16581.1 MAG: hypothetical protein COT61_03155 [Candidatus Portnoybacteria bacterium CG09_land_8_20_14_0_10_44_13]PIW75614.1 MAG: hypothetical protein CO002_01040 [Candidatus Portnoybacteria bacterium CG_4_8_14_3_um_filter_44_10]PIZ71281.1 MAG: hypothetical protein COY11_01590 [Candidatus Portnoybacteria bacterium CG_4_10_14_0_2_um_filter_44_20]